MTVKVGGVLINYYSRGNSSELQPIFEFDKDKKATITNDIQRQTLNFAFEIFNTIQSNFHRKQTTYV